MKVDTDGKVLVGEEDASSVPHIFAIGDVAAVGLLSLLLLYLTYIIIPFLFPNDINYRVVLN